MTTRTVYLNGAFVPDCEAKISCLDRGFLFGDGVYEVTAVVNGCPVDADGHFARLRRSLSELRIPNDPAINSSISISSLQQAQMELIQRNSLREGIVYLQITRGAAPERDFAFPDDAASMSPTVVMMTRSMNLVNNPKAKAGITVITVPDIRWKRRDIKTIGLLAQVLAKQAARDAEVDDAWMVDEDGLVTEGASSNAFIVVNRKLITRALSNSILHGITRRAVLQLLETSMNSDGAAAEAMTLEERGFTVEEAQQADEAFSTSASSFVMPVVKIDGVVIGNGDPGPVTHRLRNLYIRFALSVSSAS